MKKSFTFMLALAACLTANAQKPEMAQATVHYKFTHLRDTTQRDKLYTESMVLFVGPTASVYKSYDKKLQDALMRKQVADQMAEQKGSGSFNIKVSNRTPTTATEIYQFPAQKKVYRKERLITPYLIEEQNLAMNWKVTTDTATFSGLHCQKATTHFRGRDYTAWFCPDLPYRTGPWKLGGLPGLIIEAYDTNKEVIFKFDGLEEVVAGKPAATEFKPALPGESGVKIFGGDDPNADPNLIALPTDAVKTNDIKFKELQDAMRKDPQAFMASMGGGATMRMAPPGAPVAPAGSGPQISSINIVNSPGGVRTINNPIELPEKK